MAADDEVLLPSLLRGARRTYAEAIRAALVDAGCEDVPRHGVFVLGAIGRSGTPLSQIIDRLGISKQAAGQLVDTLVTRCYLERSPDPDDRRRLTVTLTERGRLAAGVARAAVERVDAALVRVVGEGDVLTTRRTLVTLCDVGRDGGGGGGGGDGGGGSAAAASAASS